MFDMQALKLRWSAGRYVYQGNTSNKSHLLKATAYLDYNYLWLTSFQIDYCVNVFNTVLSNWFFFC